MAIKNVFRPAFLMQSAMKLTFWNSPRCCRTSVTQTCAAASSLVNCSVKSAGVTAMASRSYVSTVAPSMSVVSGKMSESAGSRKVTRWPAACSRAPQLSSHSCAPPRMVRSSCRRIESGAEPSAGAAPPCSALQLHEEQT